MATADEKLNAQLAGAAALAGQIDRQQLAEKTRVYTLAKQLGISSKVLLEQLGTIGISKKAQSALSTAEVTQLLDSLQSAQPEAPSKEPAPKKAAKKSAKATKKATKATKKTDTAVTYISHEELKASLTGAKLIIRTGDTTPFANVIFRCGKSLPRTRGDGPSVM